LEARALPDQLDLPDLFRRCQRNEEAACKAVYVWVSSTVAGIVNGRFANLSRVERDEAADRARYQLTQAMLLGQIDAVNAPNNWPLLAYLKEVVENAARDVLRRRRGTDVSDELRGHAADEPAPDRQASAHESLTCVERVLNSLEATDRLIFFSKLNGVPTRAVAADVRRLFRLVVTTQAIDTRFSRLRTKLRRECRER
jgi:DNA-directed RNA polymerase specialized sigma24 family protein